MIVELYDQVVTYNRVWKKMGGSQNFERRNVKRSIFRNFKIANIKITKDELFDSFTVEFIFFISYKLFEPEYLIILSNCKILIFQMKKK